MLYPLLVYTVLAWLFLTIFNDFDLVVYTIRQVAIRKEIHTGDVHPIIRYVFWYHGSRGLIMSKDIIESRDFFFSLCSDRHGVEYTN